MAAVSLGTAPAYAEGYFSSSIGGWLTGKESSRWNDNNRDSVSTYIRFSGCSVSAGTFRYAGLQLKQDREWLPDPVVGRANNACNTVYYGDKPAGKYYFTYSNLNGEATAFAALTVNQVVVAY
ncbi:hypothetical protein [Streptomyces sp. NPDC000229]|uniref:hypothetical protein n=1 Tax=Streptomyces sp. NPDC000229 TaxID=3154247 RepID=UPI00332156BA